MQQQLDVAKAALIWMGHSKAHGSVSKRSCGAAVALCKTPVNLSMLKATGAVASALIIRLCKPHALSVQTTGGFTQQIS
jgi:hypothetical protein